MHQKYIIFFCIFFLFTHAEAQIKKNKQKPQKADTVFVYEKVIVRDTIYLEKSIPLQPKSVELKTFTITEKEIQDLSLKKSKKNLIPKLSFGIEAGLGFKENNWFSEISNKKQMGESFGIWVQRSIIFPYFSIGVSAQIQHWNSTINFDENIEESPLNGYYFTEDHQPLLFRKFNNKSWDYLAQLKLSYHWKGFKAFAGPLLNYNSYEMQFLVPKNRAMSEIADFETKTTTLGWVLGLEYKFYKKISLFFQYQQYQNKGLEFKNTDYNFVMFNSNTKFVERKYGFGLSYQLSR